MSNIPVVVESTEGNYKSEVNSNSEFEKIIDKMNVSPDGTMIIIGSLAIRAGSIKVIYLQEEQ